MNKAAEGGNGGVLIESGFALGFEFVRSAGSLRELGEFQFQLILGLELQAADHQALETLGGNLLKCWQKLGYRRLSERDLPAKRFLKDSADLMVSEGVPDGVAQITMVLLLARLFDHTGPAWDWATQSLGEGIETLPEEVKTLLRQQ